MDRKNITYENFTMERVLCWRFLLEYYRTVIKYMKGTDNYAVYLLRRFPLINSHLIESEIKGKKISEKYSVNKLEGDTFPLTYQMIYKYQWKEKELVYKLNA